MKYYPEFGEERAYIDTEKCMGCGNCVINCCIGARKMKLVQPPEFVPDGAVERFYSFPMINSTITGKLN